MRMALLAVVTVFSQLLFGCGGCDTSGRQPVRFTDGSTNESNTLYESGPIDGEYLHFPSGRVFDLVHGLVATPYLVQSYVAFEPDPLNSASGDDDDNTSNFSESAGNQAVVEAINQELIRVRNDTCAEFYLRVVALADPGAR